MRTTYSIIWYGLYLMCPLLMEYNVSTVRPRGTRPRGTRTSLGHYFKKGSKILVGHDFGTWTSQDTILKSAQNFLWFYTSRLSSIKLTRIQPLSCPALSRLILISHTFIRYLLNATLWWKGCLKGFEVLVSQRNSKR